jgi:hypothetical protein
MCGGTVLPVSCRFPGFNRAIIRGMKKHILVAFFLLCSAVMLKAQDVSPQSDPSGVAPAWKTAGTFNGRFWNQLSPYEKWVFLFGYSTGVEQVSVLAGEGSFDRYKKVSKLFWARALTVDEVRSALNGFYETPENAPIAYQVRLILFPNVPRARQRQKSKNKLLHFAHRRPSENRSCLHR